MELWEEREREEYGLPVAQKWKDWETCSGFRVRGRERAGLLWHRGNCACMLCEPVPMCLFIARSGVQLFHPHTRF